MCEIFMVCWFIPERKLGHRKGPNYSLLTKITSFSSLLILLFLSINFASVRPISNNYWRNEKGINLVLLLFCSSIWQCHPGWMRITICILSVSTTWDNTVLPPLWPWSTILLFTSTNNIDNERNSILLILWGQVERNWGL